MPIESAPVAPAPQLPPEAQQPPQAPQPPAPQSAMQRMESDPNLAMDALIARRRTKKEAESTPKAGETPEKPAESGAETPSSDRPKLGDLIAKALKFTPKPEENKAEAPVVPDLTQDKPAKTIVSKKKPAPEPIDTGKLVSDAAMAATAAAVRAMQPSVQRNEPAPVKLEDSLKEDDRREYLTAKHLSETNPKFKGAEKIVLDHIKKSEDYASRWEESNPGRVFSPDDDEHDTFYEALEKPWSDREFRDAEIEIKAEQIVERKLRGSNAKFKELEQDSARIELAPTVDRAFTSAAGLLAKSVGEDVHERITKGGFSKLEEEDPITAEVLTHTLGPLQPIIETIIQLDDPRGRFAIDPNNPLHQKWNEILLDGEARCAGRTDQSGKMFASRADFGRMNTAQREKHWYLTPDHLVSGVVDFAAKTAAQIIKTEKDRYKKIAESMGYALKSAPAAGSSKSDATKVAQEVHAAAPPAHAAKPVSPSVGSGAPIDAKGEAPKGGRAVLMDAFSKTLFGR